MDKSTSDDTLILDQFGRPMPAKPPPIDERRQRALIDRLKTLPLMDAAYLYEENLGSFDRIPLPHLRDLFPDHPGAEVVAAYRKASQLLRDAYEFGDRCLAPKLEDGLALVEEMRQRHPGFSAQTYGLALLWGCNRAR